MEINNNGITTIDWKNPKAVITLNKAILYVKYKIKYWEIKEGSLCPPISSRVYYLEWIVELLNKNYGIEKEKLKNLFAMDLGTGENVIYPILGVKKYGIKFVGTDIDGDSISNA